MVLIENFPFLKLPSVIMSLVHIETKTIPDFYHSWIKEIHKAVCRLTEHKNPIYLVYPGSYVHIPHFASAVCDPTEEYMDEGPVHCSPPETDMCLTSYYEWSGIADTYLAEYALEDIKLGDVVLSLQRALEVGMDAETKAMHMFVVTASHSDTTALKSFINYKCRRTIYPGVKPIKHSVLELRSEMMRCNSDMYYKYKHKCLQDVLRRITEEARSRDEIEYLTSSMVYEILCDRVVSCQNTIWCFQDNVWQERPYDGYIWNILTHDLIEYLESNNADQIALYTMSSTVRSKIMKDVRNRLQNDDFCNLLDSRQNIILMKNGVYNTETDKLTDPVPSDYVSVISNVSYQIFDNTSSEISRLISILRTIFPDPDVLEFFLDSCSTFLEGYNNQKLFYVWWGKGNNAKSLVQTLVMKTLGEYCSTAPTSLVTGQRGASSNATPELCHIDKKLVVFLQEPNPEEKIRAGKIKEMTGNDKMYVRQLFKSGKTMTLKAKIVIVCNNIIEIPGMDAAVRRRIVVIPFLTTFLDADEYIMRREKGTLDRSRDRHIDISVERTLIQCRSAFMYIMCQRYQKFRDSGRVLAIPPIIRQMTDEYITTNNYPLRFIRSYVHRVEGSAVTLTEMYEMFKEWFDRSYPRRKVQDFEKFTKELIDEGYTDNGDGTIQDVFVSYASEIN
jgi:P4 family phage/plasmid primase-like protien